MAPEVTAWQFVLAVAAFLLVFDNAPLWRGILDAASPATLADGVFLASIGVVLLVAFNLLGTAIALPYILKPVTIVVLLTSAVAVHFMSAYGVMLDRTMMRNVFETDPAEVFELLNAGLVGHVLVLGVLPAIVVARTRIRYRSFRHEARNRIALLVASLLTIGATALVFNKDFAILGREHREIRYLINPTNYIYSTMRFVSRSLQAPAAERIPIGEDARLSAARAGSPRRRVVVLVVGETARAQNFSLDGYERDTNPRLAREDIISFQDARSCGTSTAESLPCMFSHLTRHEYDRGKARHYENLLDVVSRAGVHVLWRDNNSGCKGLCDRVDHEDVVTPFVPELCRSDECYDEKLIDRLDDRLGAMDRDALIVLHQRGSHGPSYHLRVPPAFEVFRPICATNDVRSCSTESLLNAYDNTILYTDHVLAELIGFLRARTDRFDSVVLYASDHGESLGEKGLYLHGLPYWMAPDEQTHIPMILWLSDAERGALELDRGCLEAKADTPVSHDNLFDSILGVLGIETSVYTPERDLFASCRTAAGSPASGEIPAKAGAQRPGSTPVSATERSQRRRATAASRLAALGFARTGGPDIPNAPPGP